MNDNDFFNAVQKAFTEGDGVNVIQKGGKTTIIGGDSVIFDSSQKYDKGKNVNDWAYTNHPYIVRADNKDRFFTTHEEATQFAQDNDGIYIGKANSKDIKFDEATHSYGGGTYNIPIESEEQARKIASVYGLSEENVLDTFKHAKAQGHSLYYHVNPERNEYNLQEKTSTGSISKHPIFHEEEMAIDGKTKEGQQKYDELIDMAQNANLPLIAANLEAAKEAGISTHFRIKTTLGHDGKFSGIGSGHFLRIFLYHLGKIGSHHQNHNNTPPRMPNTPTRESKTFTLYSSIRNATSGAQLQYITCIFLIAGPFAQIRRYMNSNAVQPVIRWRARGSLGRETGGMIIQIYIIASNETIRNISKIHRLIFEE